MNPPNFPKSSTWAALGLLFFTVAGCHAPRPAIPPVSRPPTSPAETLKAYLIGPWENRERKGRTARMTFNPDGTVIFQGAMEFFNPGRWTLDAGGGELVIAFPQAPDDKLSIFKLYVGQGVKAFDRESKQVTYRFDRQTPDLNVAGWTFAKPSEPVSHIEQEPVLK
jgi:hypothetical protein